MLLKHWCYLFIFSALCSCASLKNNSSSNCKKYFPGKWKYDDLPVSTIYVERTKKKQYEYIQNGKYYYEYDIDWINKCKYKMIFISTNDPTPEVIQKGDVLTVEITNINQSMTQYKTNYNGQTDSGTMTKID